ncbi:hypothetical protein N7539_000799 [Penicillium diatomitis]|uniref:Aminoglycoside phosphotransferase domain-containing protein n=1 Tax=Penicillium diatomitis TaxID=2819901 RepID=A0A9X0C2I3_9EURO|nr:uncharacterized protein N7539_000799 [Penicillium diatomitis]KAJ5495683.1 hypothetical protein N7539_000799 [Penicillium diatomitis]
MLLTNEIGIEKMSFANPRAADSSWTKRTISESASSNSTMSIFWYLSQRTRSGHLSVSPSENNGMFNRALLMSMDDGREVVVKVLITWTKVLGLRPGNHLKIPSLVSMHGICEQTHILWALNLPSDEVKAVPLSEVGHDLELLPAEASSTSCHGASAKAIDELFSSLVFRILAVYTTRSGTGMTKVISHARCGMRAMGYVTAVSSSGCNARDACHPEAFSFKTKKLTLRENYHQIVDALIPLDAAITKPYLWHNDLHDDSVFIDPLNPESRGHY